MTYKEHFERLNYEYNEASKEFHKFRGRLSKTRQHKLRRISKYSAAKLRFEETSNSYWSFINFWLAHKLNPADEYSPYYLVHKIYAEEIGKWGEPSELNIMNSK
jgi:hypothetical protein